MFVIAIRCTYQIYSYLKIKSLFSIRSTPRLKWVPQLTNSYYYHFCEWYNRLIKSSSNQCLVCVPKYFLIEDEPSGLYLAELWGHTVYPMQLNLAASMANSTTPFSIYSPPFIFFVVSLFAFVFPSFKVLTTYFLLTLFPKFCALSCCNAYYNELWGIGDKNCQPPYSIYRTICPQVCPFICDLLI